MWGVGGHAGIVEPGEVEDKGVRRLKADLTPQGTAWSSSAVYVGGGLRGHGYTGPPIGTVSCGPVLKDRVPGVQTTRKMGTWR